jgi:Predicted drug exporters of the RND superfamily
MILFSVIGFAVIQDRHIATNFTIDGTQSEQVLDKLRSELPQASGGQGSIVFVAANGQRVDEPQNGTAIAQAITAIRDLDFVLDPGRMAAQNPTAGPPDGLMPNQRAQAVGAQPKVLIANGKPVPGVLVSPDGTTALLQLQFSEQIDDLPEGAVDDLVSTAESKLAATGLTVLTGKSLSPMHPPIGGHEVLGLLVAAVVLLLTLGSLRAAGLPLITALTGVGIGVGGAFALSKSIELTSATPVLALMVGLAVGIDYALFIINRQRQLILESGHSAEEATGRAMGTAGTAVFFAGATVVVALAGLTMIGVGFLTTMALVAAVTVTLAVFIVLTLLPAMLGIIGERICSPRARANHARYSAIAMGQDAARRGIAARWMRIVIRKPWRAITLVVVILGIAALPMASMTLGMPSGSTANKTSTERQSYDAIAEGFGEGFNGPLIIVVEPKDKSGSVGMREVKKVTTDLEAKPGVASAQVLGVSGSGSLGIVKVFPTTGPDSAETVKLVAELRAPDSDVSVKNKVTIGVTGLTAVNIDISAKLADVFPGYVAIIVVISLAILLLVFRSIVIPIKATLGFLLTIVATFGLSTAVFQWGWGMGIFGFDTTGPLLSFLPIMVTGILFGLAMDYEMFLVTSMRESHAEGRTEPVAHGFRQAGKVVAAAATIMVSVFAGFIFSDDPMIKQFGFALAVGILIDAFLVRMTLVPAIMALLGERAWWMPGRLDRILPDLDVEGEHLRARLSTRDAIENRVGTSGVGGH